MRNSVHSPFHTRQKMINILYIVFIALLFLDESATTDPNEAIPCLQHTDSIISSNKVMSPMPYVHIDSGMHFSVGDPIRIGYRTIPHSPEYRLSIQMPNEVYDLNSSGVIELNDDQPGDKQYLAQALLINDHNDTTYQSIRIAYSIHKPFIRLEEQYPVLFTGIRNTFNLHISDIEAKRLTFESDNAFVEYSDSGVFITPMKTTDLFAVDVKVGNTVVDRYSFQSKDLPLPDMLCLTSKDSSVTQCRINDRIPRLLLSEAKAIYFSNSLYPQVRYRIREFSIVKRDALGNANKEVIRDAQIAQYNKLTFRSLRGERVLLLTDIRLVVNNSFEQILSSFSLNLQ